MEIGNRIRQIRLQRGLSQRKLAQLAGLHHPAVNAVENGRRIPTLITLQKIASALDVSLSDLIE